MRAEDVRECAAMGHGPKQALRMGLRASIVALTAMVDGRPEAMLGVAPINLMEDLGSPWMLGTDVVMDHGRELLAWGPGIVAGLHRYFARLENLVSADNGKAIRLLRRWGFEVADDVRLIGGVEFVTFSRKVA